MTQTIEQLTARVRELEEENARLKAECDDIKQVQFPRKLEAVAVGWKKKLVAEQLNNKLLREALNQWIGIAANCSIESGCCCCGGGDEMSGYIELNRTGFAPFDDALSLIEDAGTAYHHTSQWIEDGWNGEKPYLDQINESIAFAAKSYLNLQEQISELTQQRDLAVEALEKWDMFFGGDAETAVLTIAEDPSTLTGCQKATKEAMSAIKESEAK